MRPLIGIPPCLDDRGRWRPGREYQYVDTAYARAIDEAGGTPIYLPLQGDPRELTGRIDGLLLPGGDDLPPDRPYPDSVGFDLAPEAQIRFDRSLLDASLDRGIPLLGVCYGMQLLALGCDGTLHFDLATDLPDADDHRESSSDDRHPIRIESGTRLASLLDETESVNSRHHQAVADPGRARIAARSEDGVVEAIELSQHRFAIGVQWHPESLDPAHRAKLFGPFVAACRDLSR